MSPEPVTREIRTTVTVHASTEGVALRQAAKEVEARLEAAADGGRLTDWDVTDAAVEEYPVAPFEPFQIEVSLAVTVDANGDDTEAAEATIRSACADVDLPRWRFVN